METEILEPEVYTRQHMFNVVVRHLRKQNAKSLNPRPNTTVVNDFYCAYKTPTGLKCAIGALIPDDLWVDELNYSGPIYSVLSNPQFEAISTLLGGHKNSDFLQDLQRIHDNNDIENWEKQFEYFAKEYNLTIPEIVEV